MEERNLQRIAKHLQTEAAQKRILRSIQRGRNEVTVTIGRAARLFGFSESQLRDWERLGLISPMRPREGTDNKQVTGQRQYTFTELDKLAIIRELLDEARLTPGSIPHNIDEIWYELSAERNHTLESSEQGRRETTQAQETIDRRVLEAYQHKLGWRFYTSRALWLALHLIYEDVPGFHAGLILPMEQSEEAEEAEAENTLPAGEALVGWLGQTQTFFVFLTSDPTFNYASDYLTLPLCPTNQRGKYATTRAKRTRIVVQREEIQHVRRSEKAIQAIQRLLEPIYMDKELWSYYIGQGMRDVLTPGMDLSTKLADSVLTELTNMVIRLGGQKDGHNRWHTSCILLPNHTHLPLQQRSLIVRAKSQQAMYTIGVSAITPERHSTSITLRAYQGGHIIYRADQARDDISIYTRDTEEPIRSHIAIPIGSEIGSPLGVLYITAYRQHAFLEEDQRVLRLMVKIIEELLCIYQTRQRLTEKLADILEDTTTVDPLFKEFASENDFLRDIEALLAGIKKQMERSRKGTQTPEVEEQTKEISFIAIDIDSSVQESIANSYGDQTLYNLNKAIGVRIRDLLPALFTNYHNCQLYHMYAGRYYLFLRGFSLEKTKNNAERLRKALEGNIAVKQSNHPGGTLTLPDISIHSGVTWYSYEKMQDFLDPEQQRSFSDISSTIYHSLDFVLKLGTGIKGGNIVYAWDPTIQTFAPYQPEEEKK